MLPKDIAAQATLAHIGVAVTDLEAAAAFYTGVLGAVPHPDELADGARIRRLTLGGVDIELLHAGTAETPIGKFLSKRGPGLHHLCFRVPDLEAALAACTRAGYRLIDRSPRPGAGGHRVAFLHPHSTSGVLLELTD